MKQITKLILVFSGLIFAEKSYSQCGTSANLGSASNMFTLIRNSTNPIVADKNLNTVIHIHRNDINIYGGNNGLLRYDISTNSGTTWTNNIGTLNPLLNTGNSGRYPNITIHNPTGNTNPNNAFLGHLDATVDFTANVWTGQLTGVRQLNGLGNTENYNQASNGGMLIPSSLVKGAPGIYWAVDAMSTGNGFKIYKGTWNGSTDINWVTNYSVTPSMQYNLSDASIAFDPTGTFGYMSFLGHLIGGPVNAAINPVFYKTIDGGNTWTGPVEVDVNQFSCITANIAGGNVPTCGYESDLTVDVNGNPHFFTTIGNGNNGYSIYFNQWHHMYDITSFNGVWNAYDVANVNAGRATWGVSPNTAQMDWAPQISRTADGKKIFFSWADNSTYLLGDPNLTPNLFSRGFDVQTYKWTGIKDFTSCNVALNGLILFPHAAPDVLEPSLTSYKIPYVYGEYTVAGDPLSACNFKFLDNATFINADFSINQPMASAVIQQGNNWLLCPATTASLSITGTYDAVLWSNGAITNTTSISTPSNYIVTVRNGCALAADTIIVTSLTTVITPTNAAFCSGSATTPTLNVTGNALSYTWTPGNITTNSIVVSSTITATTVYTVNAAGNNCVYPQTLTVTVNPLPTLTITGTSTVCPGNSVLQTASGAVTYTWSTGAPTASTSMSPSSNTSYTVTGTDINSCVNSAVVTITTIATPSIIISSASATICSGQSTTLTTTGAPTFTWNTGSNASSIVVSPTVSTIYSASGTGTTGCSSTKSFTQNVVSCAGIKGNEIDGVDVVVFPNPTSGVFNITLPIDLNATITVYNMVGSLIYSYNVIDSKTEIDMRKESNGIYFVRITTSNGSLIKRIVKE
jgi:hypothetical protein